jgi:hypothetical protein
MKRGQENQKEKATRERIVGACISNGNFFFWTFKCWIGYVLQVNGDGEYVVLCLCELC